MRYPVPIVLFAVELLQSGRTVNHPNVRINPAEIELVNQAVNPLEILPVRIKSDVTVEPPILLEPVRHPDKDILPVWFSVGWFPEAVVLDIVLCLMLSTLVCQRDLWGELV